MLILEVPKSTAGPVLVTKVETGLCTTFSDLATAFYFSVLPGAEERFERKPLFPRATFSFNFREFYIVHLNGLS